jgi:hypothetical protein
MRYAGARWQRSRRPHIPWCDGRVVHQGRGTACQRGRRITRGRQLSNARRSRVAIASRGGRAGTMVGKCGRRNGPPASGAEAPALLLGRGLRPVRGRGAHDGPRRAAGLPAVHRGSPQGAGRARLPARRRIPRGLRLAHLHRASRSCVVVASRGVTAGGASWEGHGRRCGRRIARGVAARLQRV